MWRDRKARSGLERVANFDQICRTSPMAETRRCIWKLGFTIPGFRGRLLLSLETSAESISWYENK